MSSPGTGLGRRDEFVVKAVEGCRPCGGGRLPILLEATRFNFVLTQHIGSSAFQVFREVVIMSKGEWRKFGDMVGFRSPRDGVRHAMELFRAVDFPMHTLEEHVEMLKVRYNDERKEFGPLRFVQLPFGGSWQVYDPGARDFGFLPTFPTSEGNGANLREGSIVRSFADGNQTYYRFIGLNLEGRQVMHRIAKDAAYELVVPFLRPVPAYWVRYPELNVGVVHSWQLGDLPREVWQALVRLNPLQRSLQGVFILDEGDFAVAQKLLGYARIELKQAVEVVKLPFQKDLLHGSPVIPLSDVPSEKLDAFTTALESATGSTTTREERLVRIGQGSATVPMYFVYGDHGSGMDGKLYVALPNIVDSEKAVFLLQSLARQLGAILDESKARRALAVRWPSEEPGDAAFCLRTLVEGFGDEGFVRAFIGYPRHKDLAVSWCNDIKAQSILGKEMLTKAKTVCQQIMRSA